MYLKSIEIHGFKSFANKIVLEFHDGITAIVGPNGSGKSNVADAVRWVLGEQSAKQLRGAKMEDVIFAGTEMRKPLGFAYVAITLDNSDHKLPIEYNQVTVARRVYRSGESEYLINNSSCRLKDVQELFLDTGIGKEGYSIIGQGQIDKILSGKPEERRELFDEAAGIVKFKKRKAIAEKNLESEKQNLCRIQDILGELEKQVVPLENQSKTAREYLKRKEELKILDVSLFTSEYSRIKDETNKSKERIDIVSNDLEQAKIEHENTKEEYSKLEGEIALFDETIESKKSSSNEQKLAKEKLEGTINVLKEQINAVTLSKDHYCDRIDTIKKDIDLKTVQLQENNIQKSDNDKTLVELNETQADVVKAHEKMEEEIVLDSKGMESGSSEIIQLLNENSTLKTSLQRFETMIEQSQIKKVELNQRWIKLKSDETLINEKSSKYETELLSIASNIDLKKAENEKLDQIINEQKVGIDNCAKSIAAKQQDYHRYKSKRDSLKNITERYEGYGNSIRKIMEIKEKQRGIVGVVADIIQVEKRYETAIEIALGGNIQNIVTDTEKTAKQLVVYLKENKYGRATFLPLTSVSNSTPFKNTQALSEKGVIGLASDLVLTEDKFKSVLDYLLGKTIIVDNIDNAINIAKKYKYTVRIVTLEGEQLNPGGSISGGAYKNASNLLGRRREIEDLKEQIENIQTQVQEESKLLEQLRDARNENRDNLEKNKSDIQALSIEQNTINVKRKQVQNSKEANLTSYDEITKESRDIDELIRELKENADKIKAELDINTQKSKEHEQKIEYMNKSLEEKKKVEKEYREKASNVRMEYLALEQQSLFISQNITRLQEEIEKDKKEILDIEHNLEVMSEEVSNKDTEILSIRDKIKGIDELITVSEMETIEIQQKKEKLSKIYKSFFDKREYLSEQMNSFDKELFRLNNQLEKLNEQLDSYINYMWEEYELTYNSSLSFLTDEEISVPAIKKSIAELKNIIKSLGDVNVNAIEDYKNLSERFELLKTQKDDLVRAEEVLQNIIKELDVEMRKQFEEKFLLIKSKFDSVFKELFGGGKGTLELMEDEDILTAGIKINAQPPGKKLQNMMQLSGGEKALTAIALLFAIQNLKPSPFCLLDEIEAALDDSNVGRYAKYLHKLTKRTQFIVITHRRGTMASSDVLYGITMQEKGVSTLVSVNLIENELDK